MTTTAELRRNLHSADLQWERQHDLAVRAPAGPDWVCALVWGVFVLWCLAALAGLSALAVTLLP